MKKMDEPVVNQELTALCGIVRRLVEQKDFGQGELLIKKAIGDYIHAPEPHNLLGLLLEAQSDHLTAMKHFRAAWALDPTYLPARQNLDYFGSFYPNGKQAFDESDCPLEKKGNSYVVVYDANGIRHVVRRV